MKKMKGLLGAAVLGLGVAAASSAWAGPVILMGIDAEDGGPGGHGPITVYQAVVNSLLGQVTNGGSGVLVIGGGKDVAAPVDQVTAFWQAIDTAIPGSVTFVNGASIAGQSFAGFAAIAIVSAVDETPSGGLTDAESNAVNARAAGIAAFVNVGGGLFGLSQEGVPTPYGYLGNIGAFTTANPTQYDNITPTPDGTAVGITDALDVCCWHDTYLTFPSFLSVLATHNDGGQAQGQAAAIGGATVIITHIPEPGTLALLGMALVAGFAASRRKAARIQSRNHRSRRSAPSIG